VADELFALDPSEFCELLVRWNNLAEAGFALWEFLPGMRFAERETWWRAGAGRGDAHEGLDVCWFLTADGRRLSLGAGARVPVIYAGEVVSVVADFLGTSVFVAHERRDSRGWQLHTIYGHIEPRSGLVSGSLLDVGEAVGTVADTSGRTSAVPPHLHVTLALIAGGRLSATRLNWASLRDPNRAILLDPMSIMSCGADDRRSPDAPPRG